MLPVVSAPTLPRLRSSRASSEPSTARRHGPAVRTLEWLGGILVSLGALGGFLLYPTYPNYDSVYSLIWGRELLHGQALSFQAYRAPTEHPLAIAIGALVSLTGGWADRIFVALAIAGFVALVFGLFFLGREAFPPLVGAVAAILVVTRFNFPFLAARGYIDPGYLALVVWAAVLELRRPRRGGLVFVLLVCAALLRPEAWLIIGLYFLWMLPGISWRRRAMYAVITAIGPVV